MGKVSTVGHPTWPTQLSVSAAAAAVCIYMALYKCWGLGLGICIAPELEKIGFKPNTVSQLSVPATPPWLLRHPVIDLSLHSSDKAVRN